MQIILDLLVLIVIAITAIISAYKGFIRSVIEFVGFIAALVLAVTISTPLADITYTSLIEKPLIENVDSSMENNVDAVWEALPDFVTDNSAAFGIEKSDIAEFIAETAGENATVAVQKVSQSIVKPVAIQFISSLYTCVIFIVLMIVVHFLAKVINKLFSLPIIGKLNRILGAVLGLLKGCLICFVVCSVIGIVVSFLDDGIWIFNQETIAESLLFRFFLSFSPFQ